MLETAILGGKTLALGMFKMAQIKVSHQEPWINPLHLHTSKYDTHI